MDSDNVQLMEQGWFLLLIATSTQEAAKSLLEFRAFRANSPTTLGRIGIEEFHSNQFSQSGAQARPYPPAKHDVQRAAIYSPSHPIFQEALSAQALNTSACS